VEATVALEAAMEGPEAAAAVRVGWEELAAAAGSTARRQILRPG